MKGRAASTLLGCKGGLHNVCRREVAHEHLYDRLGTRLNAFVDANKKAAKSGTTFLEIVGTLPGAGSVYTYVLLGGVVLKPKVQTYVLCAPTERQVEPGNFVTVDPPDEPWVLQLLSGPCRLSLPAADHKHEALLHEASDELCLRLSNYPESNFRVGEAPENPRH